MHDSECAANVLGSCTRDRKTIKCAQHLHTLRADLQNSQGDDSHWNLLYLIHRSGSGPTTPAPPEVPHTDCWALFSCAAHPSGAACQVSEFGSVDDLPRDCPQIHENISYLSDYHDTRMGKCVPGIGNLFATFHSQSRSRP